MTTAENTTEVRYPEVEVLLVGEDGNAFTIMGAVARGLRKAGVSADEVDEYRRESMSGDYNHLLATAQAWVTVY